MKVNALRCWVTVRTGNRGKSPFHEGAATPRPAMLFALPRGGAHAETDPEPAETATEERAARAASQAAKPAASSRKTDPHLVANRVYELMREEIRLTRMRGG